MRFSLPQQLLAEFIGTYFLVFFGTGAIVINSITDGAIGHLGISVAFGLVVLCMIYAVGHISGAHMNPAVTLAFYVAEEINLSRVFWFSIIQVSAAIIASLTLRLLFPESLTLGETLPKESILQTLVLEFILSFFLMFVIINVATGAKEKGLLAGIAVGFAVLICALVGGPISGASMNPARSIGPALANFNLDHLWVYLVGPFTGTVASIIAWQTMAKRPKKLEANS